MVFAESASGGFDILLLQHRGDIGGDELVLRHLVRLHPDSHGIVASEQHHVAYAANALDARLYVDLHVVVQKLEVVFVVA